MNTAQLRRNQSANRSGKFHHEGNEEKRKIMTSFSELRALRDEISSCSKFAQAGQICSRRTTIAVAAVMALVGWMTVSACSGLKVGGQVQAGRNALQTGRPQEAVAYLAAAAESDPGYRIPYRVGEGVLTYLGRAYYETGGDREAQSALEKSLELAPDDHLARLYLGLVRLRGGATDTGRQQVNAGLTGLHELLDDLAADNVYGLFWDPAGALRSEIRNALTAGTADAAWIASVERIGREFDEEIDKARDDEVRTRSRSSGGGD